MIAVASHKGHHRIRLTDLL